MPNQYGEDEEAGDKDVGHVHGGHCHGHGVGHCNHLSSHLEMFTKLLQTIQIHKMHNISCKMFSFEMSQRMITCDNRRLVVLKFKFHQRLIIR